MVMVMTIFVIVIVIVSCTHNFIDQVVGKGQNRSCHDVFIFCYSHVTRHDASGHDVGVLPVIVASNQRGYANNPEEIKMFKSDIEPLSCI